MSTCDLQGLHNENHCYVIIVHLFVWFINSVMRLMQQTLSDELQQLGKCLLSVVPLPYLTCYVSCCTLLQRTHNSNVTDV